jgi:hypothetical protein
MRPPLLQSGLACAQVKGIVSCCLQSVYLFDASVLSATEPAI